MVCEVFEQCRKNPQNQYQNCKNCRQINSNSVVVCSEKKSRYALQNPNHVSITIFHVDGGVVRDEECCRKCDYIYDISMPLKSIAIFIELKGKHLVDALEQIENSVKLFMPTFKKTIILGRIIFCCGEMSVHGISRRDK